ncbi:hypothetical protein ACO0LM_16180 [Undibacterium sp. Di26W]|uniref:hypothetical protein n=1 Tax=Undibacterium sp. Di26W TaxID=3413035 RepID=UPI003BEFB25F
MLENNNSSMSTRKIVQLLLSRFESEVCIEGINSQLRAVTLDLVTSIVTAAHSGAEAQFKNESYLADFLEEQEYRIKNFVSMIPRSFHNYEFQTSNGARSTLFDLPPREFIKSVETVKNEPTDKLATAYGVVWFHSQLLSEFQTGKKSKAHQENCLFVYAESVESLAQDYLEADDFISPFLEWAMVDALIYSRTLDFFQSRAFWKQIKNFDSGQLIDGPLLLEPNDISLTGSKIKDLILEFAFSALGNAIGLLGVWWLATLLTETSTEKWILFTGVMASHWIVSALSNKSVIKNAGRTKDEVNLQMLWDMCQMHERVPSMNIGLLLHLLYRLEEKGGAFSPSVYALLAKRAKRESK